MDYANLVSLAPLATLALTAVAAMVLAPLASPATVRGAAGFGVLVALILMAERYGDPAAPATALLADDGAARFGALLVTLAGLAVLGFFRGRTAGREGPALVVIATIGAATLAGATHAATLFLGLEIASLALVALFAFSLDRPALEAGYKYLLTAGTAAAALLLGIALAFAVTGALDLSIWSGDGRMVPLAAAFLVAALAFSFSLVPFHAWTPDVFEGASAGAAAFAGVATKIAVGIVLLRLDAAGMPEPLWSTALALAGGASILLGNLVALRQTSLKRMLGWSSVAHSGYVAAILASGADVAGEAALFYLLAYAPALVIALAAAAALGRDPDLSQLRGLAVRRPLAGGALALGLLSLSGLPPAAGFIGKVYLFTALAAAGAWVLLAVTALGAAVAFFYYFRFLVTAFFPAEEDAPVQPAPTASEGAVLVTGGLLVLAIGVYPGPFMALAAAAVP